MIYLKTWRFSNGGYEKGEKTLLNAFFAECCRSQLRRILWARLLPTYLNFFNKIDAAPLFHGKTNNHKIVTKEQKKKRTFQRPRCIPAVKGSKLSVSHEILNGTSLKTLQTRKRTTLSQDFFNLLLFFIAVYRWPFVFFASQKPWCFGSKTD